MAALEREAREVDSEDMQTVLAFIKVDICLVTVMLANNQTEILQPVPGLN